MCRWIAYKGSPIYIEQVVTKPTHSLVKQSFNTEMNFKKDGSLWAINGDGFGVGWYADKGTPGVFKGERPAWNDENLHEICSQVKTGLFFAHIRAQTTGQIQRSNSHPFKYKNWLFQHNGHVDYFEIIKKDILMEIQWDLFDNIKGSTDSEIFFFLAITYGLENDPHKALKKAIEKIKACCEDRKVEIGLNFSCALSDGETLYTLRYAFGEEAKSLFYSTDVDSIQDLNKDTTVKPEASIIVVSEPLDSLSDKWEEVPDNSLGIIKNGKVSFETFI